PLVAELEDLLEPFERQVAVPLAAHLEDLVAVTEEEEVEQAAVPQPPDVAVRVDEVAVPAVGDPLDDARERQRGRRTQHVRRDLSELSREKVLDLRLQLVARAGCRPA